MAFPDQDPEEIALEIDGTTYRFWSEIELTRLFDGHDEVAFSAPFDPSSIEHRETFRPFSYKEVKVLIGGEVLFTGTMLDISPRSDANSTTVDVMAYSRAEVLVDVTAPAGHPLEFNGLNLMQISQKLIEPFGLSIGPGPDVGSPFERVVLEADGKIQDFLADLAKKRGLVLASDADGDLVYRQSSTDPQPPVARLNGGESPVLGVSTTFTPREYFSEVTCIAKTKGKRKRSGGSSSKYTETNPFAVGFLRPSVQEIDDTEPADVPTAAKARIGRMFGNVCAFEIDVATWLTPAGELWTPDQWITLVAERAMVYSETKLMIRAVRLKATPSSRTATLNCVLPGSFSGDLPEDLPWLG